MLGSVARCDTSAVHCCAIANTLPVTVTVALADAHALFAGTIAHALTNILSWIAGVANTSAMHCCAIANTLPIAVALADAHSLFTGTVAKALAGH